MGRHIVLVSVKQLALKKERKKKKPQSIATANFYGINLIELYKAYGYLDDIDIDCKNNCFENTELLSDDAVSHIQGLINLLTEKRTLK